MMTEIYMDRGQCQKFEVPYVDKGTELYIAADTVLRSRDPGGYDKYHNEFLSAKGGKTLVLEGLGYGWFQVKSVI
ncbi:MAG TPA: hypothetical protein EYF95_08305 [Flavobacteriales bacterium]|jgi:hypothetical protein|nr:hypothetical protein [Flavobacteriales bacterium]